MSAEPVSLQKLYHNTSLRILNLNCESIGLEGTQKVIDSLLKNSFLEILWLPGRYEPSVRTSVAYQRVKSRIWWGGKWFVLLSVDMYKYATITIPSIFDIMKEAV